MYFGTHIPVQYPSLKQLTVVPEESFGGDGDQGGAAARPREGSADEAVEGTGDGDHGGAAGEPAPKARKNRSLLDGVLYKLVIKAMIVEYDKLFPYDQAKWSMNPKTLLEIVSALKDKQHVASAQALYDSAELIQALHRYGFPREATYVQVVSRAYQAMDARGIPPSERTVRVLDRTLMLLRIVGNLLSRPLKHFPAKLQGLTNKQIQSWLMNADARLWVIGRLSEEDRIHFNERCCSSDTVELVFMMVHNICGYKPPRRILQGNLRNISFAARIKAMPEAERKFGVSRKRKTWYMGRENASATPYDPSFLPDWVNQQFRNKRRRTHKISKKVDKKMKGRYVKIRNHHNK